MPTEGQADAPAALAARIRSPISASPSCSTVQGVTSTGQVLGSPAHMAPEQIEGGDVSASADVIGLGVLLYEALVGKLPFDGKNPAQVLRRVLDGTFTPADRAQPTVGAGLSRIGVAPWRATRRNRYQSAIAMAEALKEELAELGFHRLAPRDLGILAGQRGLPTRNTSRAWMSELSKRANAARAAKRLRGSRRRLQSSSGISPG